MNCVFTIFSPLELSSRFLFFFYFTIIHSLSANYNMLRSCPAITAPIYQAATPYMESNVIKGTEKDCTDCPSPWYKVDS